MKRIYQILEMTASQYEQLFLTEYLAWCESIAFDVIELQKLLSSNPIVKWYQMELSKCEQEFMQRISRYDEKAISLDDRIICYVDCVEKMNSISPKPLIDAAKKVETKLQNQRPPVRGLKTFSYN